MTCDSRIAARAVVTHDACACTGPATEEIIRCFGEASRCEAQIGELRDFNSTSLTKLIDYLINKHHVYARRQMTGIGALLDKLSAAHAQSHPELARVRGLFTALQQKLLFDMETEEASLFPHIISTEAATRLREPRAVPYFGLMRDSIRTLRHEHEGCGALLDEIRAAMNDYTPPARACASYRALCQALRDLKFDLLHQIYLEDSVLFPRVLKLERHGRN